MAVTGQDSSEQTAPRQGAPRLAEGVQLIGEYEGSGFKEPPSLVRRPDGQVIQLSPLLYLVAKHADGTNDYGAIAELVGTEIQRQVSADNVKLLVEDKLRPLGVMVAADGTGVEVKKLDPLLALKFRAAVIPEGASKAVAALFKPLFLPPVVLAALVGLALVDAWLFLHHGIAQGLRETLYQPGMILLVFGVVVLSAAFHEIGHATGCSYGGGEPGKMGCGLYLAWPAFYTDVTDAYRLGRMARLRTDLGGVYFNVLIILAITGLYALTGFEALLLIVVFQHAEIVHQLLPLVRLDGYYVVADLTGVPDLFSRIKPILVSVVPGKKADERVTVLKPWVRVAVTVWVLVVVPLLLFQLFMLLIHLPRILGTGWDSLRQQWDATSRAFGSGAVLGGVAGVVQLLVVALPLVAIVLLVLRLLQTVAKKLWTGTEDKPVQRVGGVALALGAAALLAMAWIPSDNYEPIRKGERGTFSDGLAAVRSVGGGRGPLAASRAAE
ncbi:MAG: hypothetical protein M3N28_01570, partial [Actinomycetota bacterium]|nr:hypothetical protein [Actinomycetota bacterium]